MIKLKQITTLLGKAIFVFSVDFPDGTVKDVQINMEDLNEQLKQLRNILGRDLTTTDLKDVIKNVINKVRSGATPFPQTFDYNSLIGSDFEQ
jgi:benzoyl-CoA reductase/2-hydroxyglutaryl-CoA dehydratase subunit BcrC/BadD/HgdB